MQDKPFQLSLHFVNNSLTDWTVYFIIIDTKKINSRDGRYTKKNTSCAPLVQPALVQMTKQLEIGESYTIFEDKAYNYHLIMD